MSNRLILLGLAAFAAGIVARVVTEPEPAPHVAVVERAASQGVGGSGDAH